MSTDKSAVAADLASIASDAVQRLSSIVGEGALTASAQAGKATRESLYARAYGLYQKAHYRQALPLFTRLAALNRLERRYVLGLAATQQMLGDHAQALTSYLTALALQPMDPWPMLRCAECLWAQGRSVEAIEALALARQLCESGYQSEAMAYAVILDARFSAHHKGE